MPLPLDERKKPADVKVHVTTGVGVDITWADGHTSHYEFVYLRDLCPCALCDDERKKKAAFEGPDAGTAPTVALPMFKPKAKAKSAAVMGNYAIQINFTDGHSTGIFSYDYLRTICPCEACKLEFRSTPQ